MGEAGKEDESEATVKAYQYSNQVLFDSDPFGRDMCERDELASRGIATPPDDNPAWELVGSEPILSASDLGKTYGKHWARAQALWRRPLTDDELSEAKRDIG